MCISRGMYQDLKGDMTFFSDIVVLFLNTHENPFSGFILKTMSMNSRQTMNKDPFKMFTFCCVKWDLLFLIETTQCTNAMNSLYFGKKRERENLTDRTEMS